MYINIQTLVHPSTAEQQPPGRSGQTSQVAAESHITFEHTKWQGRTGSSTKSWTDICQLVSWQLRRLVCLRAFGNLHWQLKIIENFTISQTFEMTSVEAKELGTHSSSWKDEGKDVGGAWVVFSKIIPRGLANCNLLYFCYFYCYFFIFFFFAFFWLNFLRLLKEKL